MEIAEKAKDYMEQKKSFIDMHKLILNKVYEDAYMEAKAEDQRIIDMLKLTIHQMKEDITMILRYSDYNKINAPEYQRMITEYKLPIEEE